MTVFEKIKSMSVDELAEMLGGKDTDEILCSCCNPAYCEHYHEDGSCAGFKQLGDSACVPATKNGLKAR